MQADERYDVGPEGSAHQRHRLAGGAVDLEHGHVEFTKTGGQRSLRQQVDWVGGFCHESSGLKAVNVDYSPRSPPVLAIRSGTVRAAPFTTRILQSRTARVFP